jgi:hypothetical protein
MLEPIHSAVEELVGLESSLSPRLGVLQETAYAVEALVKEVGGYECVAVCV